MNLIRIASACLFLLLAVSGFGIGAQEGEQPDPLTGLYRFENCVYIEAADGQSLADQLVKAGLARAFGVYRQTHRGVSQSESIDRMRDLELSAAAGRRGIWAYTYWEALPNERSLERAEIEELRAAMRLGPEVTSENPIAIDRADASALQQLPGIGPALAQRIIDQRERQAFRRKADLLKVPGIGAKTFDTLEPLITLSVENEDE